MVLSKEETVNQLRERYQIYPVLGYNYFDTPAGEDLFQKLFYTSKYAGGFGMVYGTLQVFAGDTVPKGTFNRLLGICRPVVSCVGVAAAFTLTLHYSTIIRKKDDPYNYFFGGFASGLALGKFLPTITATIYVACVLGLYASKVKTRYLPSKEKGRVTRIDKKTLSTYIKRRWDTSWVPNVKGNWTKELPKNV